MLVVQKFGGSSVANADRVRNVANIIADTYRADNDVVVVVSAQGDTTDDLIEKAAEINPRASKREMDMLLTAGEQMSASLLAMALQSMGLPVISLLGWQIGLKTDSNHSNARIKKIDNERLNLELSKRNIVILAGFQGINKYDDITTLGRGGSDTTAVAIAATLKADLCQIFTDVDGVYTADPRKVKGAQKLDTITYDEMLELATLGAQVLHNRSVEMAKKYSVNLEVCSSLERKPGTKVMEVAGMEKMLIRGVAKDDNVARVTIVGVADTPGVAYKIFADLSAAKINVDIILQSIGRDGSKDIVFTVSADQKDEVEQALARSNAVKDAKVTIDTSVTKLSIVGAGMESHPGVASKMFEALFNNDINIQMIATSEIKISVLIDKKDTDRAVQAVHDMFFSK